MTIRTVESNNRKFVIVASDEVIISDGQSALDFVANMLYEHDCHGIALNKAAVAESFFVLSTGVAGEVAQKFANFKMRFAIIGDFTGYTSKPLHDFIYESNRGRNLFFVADEDEAVARLGG